MTELIHLLYASSATQEMTDDDLVNLLKKAREKNKRLDITGTLLYRGRNFLQVLEGEKTVVQELFKAIGQDPRHYQISALITRPIAKREFAEWEMGFTNLDSIDPTSIPGYSPYLNESFTSDRFQDRTYGYTFLRIFKDRTFAYLTSRPPLQVLEKGRKTHLEVPSPCNGEGI